MIMYKALEITEIIGSFYVKGKQNISITISEVRNIMSRVNETDPFIVLRLSRQAMNRVFVLAEQEITPCLESIEIPENNSIRSRFIREYYRLDYDTRSVLSQIVDEFIRNGKI